MPNESDPLLLEDYGYPEVTFISRKVVRITFGWFFPDVNPDEPATYFDVWVSKQGKVDIVLDNGDVFFDFVTPLDDYVLGD